MVGEGDTERRREVPEDGGDELESFRKEVREKYRGGEKGERKDDARGPGESGKEEVETAQPANEKPERQPASAQTESPEREKPEPAEGERDELDRFRDEVREKYPDAGEGGPAARENPSRRVFNRENDEEIEYYEREQEAERERERDEDGPKAVDSRETPTKIHGREPEAKSGAGNEPRRDETREPAEMLQAPSIPQPRDGVNEGGSEPQVLREATEDRNQERQEQNIPSADEVREDSLRERTGEASGANQAVPDEKEMKRPLEDGKKDGDSPDRRTGDGSPNERQGASDSSENEQDASRMGHGMEASVAAPSPEVHDVGVPPKESIPIPSPGEPEETQVETTAQGSSHEPVKDSPAQRQIVDAPLASNETPRETEISSGSNEKTVAVQRKDTERIEEGPNYIASFEATAQRRQEDGRVAFEVRVDSMERQSGSKFQDGGVYVISGHIDDVGDFRKLYRPGVSEKMVIFAPGSRADSVEGGEKYDLHVRRIEEVSRNNDHLGVFHEAPYRVAGSDDRVKFDVLLDTFQERTGIRFEDGKTYEIKGTIGEITDFTLRHTRGEGKYLYITPRRETAALIEPGQKYELTVLSVEERRTFEVSNVGKVTRLTLMRQALESAGLDVDAMKRDGEGDRVIEFTLRNQSHEGEQPKRLFAKLNANEGGVIMNIAKAGASQGDSMELVKAKRYQIGSFVEDFNSHKGKDMQNVKLELDGKKLSMDVDGRKYRFTEYGLDVHTMRAMLKGEVEGFKRGLCLTFNANEGTVLPAARNNKPIKAFEASETRGFEARYKLPESKDNGEEKSSFEKRWEPSQFIGRMKLLGRSEPIENSHEFEVDDTLFQYAQERRKIPVNVRQEIGDVGEDIGAAILIKLGWAEVARHPFDRRGPGRECYLHGTDILFKNPRTKELYLFEFRWWQNSNSADGKTLRMVQQRQEMERSHEVWGKISGAYIAIVDLDKRSKVGKLRIKRAW